MAAVDPSRPWGRFNSEAAQRKVLAIARMNLVLGRRQRWLGRLTIPRKAHPLVRELFKILNFHKTSLVDLSGRVGCNYGTISDWRYRRVPNLTTFEAALNAMGYGLAIMKLDDFDEVEQTPSERKAA